MGSPLHVVLAVPAVRRGLVSEGLGWPDEHRRRKTRLRLICSANDRPCVQATAQSRSRVMLLDAKRRNLWSASESGSQRRPTDGGGLRDAHARGNSIRAGTGGALIRGLVFQVIVSANLDAVEAWVSLITRAEVSRGYMDVPQMNVPALYVYITTRKLSGQRYSVVRQLTGTKRTYEAKVVLQWPARVSRHVLSLCIRYH